MIYDLRLTIHGGRDLFKVFAKGLPVVLFLLLGSPAQCHSTESIDLAGQWRFALDRNDAGTNQAWFSKNLPDKIRLPGILQAQGYGDDIATNTPWVLGLGDAWWNLQPAALRAHFSQPGHVEVPFLSQPPKHYLGAAWYQREVDVPKSWQGRHFTLFLERAHWRTIVWLDDREIGSDASLCAPHEFDLGAVAPGKHRLTILVDNRLQLPAAGHLVDAHSISDALGAAWNGIVGKIELRSTPPVWIDDLQNFPNLTNKTVQVRGRLGNVTGLTVTNPLTLGFMCALDSMPVRKDKTITVVIPPGGTDFVADVTRDLPLTPWDEFHPVQLPWIAAYLGKPADWNKTLFTAEIPLREIATQDKEILLNGRPLNLRMTHFGGDFPLTGYPAMDVASWKKIIRTCQDYGLNGMRFHSWCPPEAAFEAADELGFYLQVECGLWADFRNPVMQQELNDETARILKNYGNHPSFILLSPSNEPRNYQHFTPEWAAENYARDNRRLYCADTGWGDPAQVNGLAQYAVLARFSAGSLRGPVGWFGRDYAEPLANVHIPVITHEVGQWCAYPDFDVIQEFTGYLQPGNYEIFKYLARQEGVLAEDKEFAQASGRFQLECYKEEIEANLRTPGLSGFQLLDLHDYLGQGTALIGVLDAFWHSKGYVTPEEFRQFCGPVVPLAWLPQRVFSTDEKLEADIGACNFSAATLRRAVVRWEVRNADGKIVAACPSNPVTDLPVGFKGKRLHLAMDLKQLPAPAVYQLVAIIDSDNGKFQNRWNFWLYPAHVAEAKTDDVLVTTNWSAAANKLAAGGKVLFLPGAGDLDPTRCPPMKNVPVFWNIQMTVRPPQNPRPRFDGFLGLLCETNHPALAEFPTDRNCDWQWTPLINNVRAINLESAPRSLKPIVWCIDDWNRNWKLGVIFEARVGKGRLLVSAINLNDENGSAELNQLRRSLLDYMGGKEFRPATTLTVPQANALWSHAGSTAAQPARTFDPDLDDGSIARPAPKR